MASLCIVDLSLFSCLQASSPPVFMGHDSLSNAYSLDVPSSFDNPSSIDTSIVSSIDAMSSSDVPSLRYPLWRLDRF